MMTKQELIEMIGQHKHCFFPEFRQWMDENYEVYCVFSRLADGLWNAGRNHYSARAILEKMRYDHAISDSSEEFKLCDRVLPELSRLYVLCRPSRLYMFKFIRREMDRDFDFVRYVELCVFLCEAA